jgi:hypothetical protein
MTDEQWENIEPLARVYLDLSRKYKDMLSAGNTDNLDGLRTGIELNLAKSKMDDAVKSIVGL